MLSRRPAALAVIAAFAALAATLSGMARADVALPAIEMHVPTPCLACIDYAEHLRARGFAVTIVEHTQVALDKLKRWINVPAELESRQTARVEGYFIEGHVPADDIVQLLKERPAARGLAVPGLPRGAPGRELSNPTCETACTMLDREDGIRDVRRELFDTLLVAPDGSTSVWARH